MSDTVNTLRDGEWCRHRLVAGAPVAADAAFGATVPPARSATERGGLLNCRGWDEVLVVVKITGGTAPTVALQPGLYDIDDDATVTLATTGLLSDGDTALVSTWGTRLFLRLDDVNGSPTAVELRVLPTKARATGF